MELNDSHTIWVSETPWKGATGLVEAAENGRGYVPEIYEFGAFQKCKNNWFRGHLSGSGVRFPHWWDPLGGGQNSNHPETQQNLAWCLFR
jgi:hypothetical protein